MKNNEQLKTSLLGWGGYEDTQEKILLNKKVVYMRGFNSSSTATLSGPFYKWTATVSGTTYNYYTKVREPKLGDYAFLENGNKGIVLTYSSNKITVLNTASSTPATTVEFTYSTTDTSRTFSTTVYTSKLYHVNIDGTQNNKTTPLLFDYTNEIRDEYFYFDKPTQCLVRIASKTYGSQLANMEQPLKHVVFETYNPNTGLRIDKQDAWGYSNQMLYENKCVRENCRQGLYSVYLNGISRNPSAGSTWDMGFSHAPTIFIYSTYHKHLFEVKLDDVLDIDPRFVGYFNEEQYMGVYNRSEDYKDLTDLGTIMYAPSNDVSTSSKDQKVYELNINLETNPCFVSTPTTANSTYTVVGSPTIDANFNVSDMSSSNYLKSSTGVNFHGSYLWTFQVGVKFHSDFFNADRTITLFGPDSTESGRGYVTLTLVYTKSSNTFVLKRSILNTPLSYTPLETSAFSLEPNKKYYFTWHASKTSRYDTIECVDSLKATRNIASAIGNGDIFSQITDGTAEPKWKINIPYSTVYLRDAHFEISKKVTTETVTRSDIYEIQGFSPFILLTSVDTFWTANLFGGAEAWKSTDAITFTRTTNMPTNWLAYGSDKNFIFLFQVQGTYLFYTKDGETWNRAQTNHQMPTGWAGRFFRHKNRLLLLESESFYMASKTVYSYYHPETTVDWLQYATRPVSSSTTTFRSAINYHGTKFMVVDNSYISTSTNSFDWTTPTSKSTLSGHNWNGLVYRNNKYYLYSTDHYVSTSSDGETWTTPSSTSLPNDMVSYTVDDEGVVWAISSSGAIYRSYNGTSWGNLGTLLSGTDWVAIYYNSEYQSFIALRKDGKAAVTTDATTWPSSSNYMTIGNYNDWRDICWEDDLCIAVGAEGNVAYARNSGSPAFTAWTSRTYTALGTTNNINRIIYDGVKYVLFAGSALGTTNVSSTTFTFGEQHTWGTTTTFMDFGYNGDGYFYVFTIDETTKKVTVYQHYTYEYNNIYTPAGLPVNTATGTDNDYYAIGYSYTRKKWYAIMGTHGHSATGYYRYMSADSSVNSNWSGDTSTPQIQSVDIFSTQNITVFIPYLTTDSFRDVLTTSTTQQRTDWTGAVQSPAELNISTTGNFMYTEELYPSLPCTTMGMMFGNNSNQINYIVNYAEDHDSNAVYYPGMIKNSITASSTNMVADNNECAGTYEEEYYMSKTSSGWNGKMNILKTQPTTAVNQQTLYDFTTTNTSYYPEVFSGPKYINSVKKITSSGTVCVIGGETYTKSYSDECYGAIITNGSYVFPLIVSKTARGATGYSTSSTTPSTVGSFTYRGQTYYYGLGNIRMSYTNITTMTNTMNLPFLNTDQTASTNLVWFAISIVKAAYYDGSYAFPLIIKDRYNNGSHKLTYKSVSVQTGRYDNIVVYDSISGSTASIVDNPMPEIPMTETHMVLTSTDNLSYYEGSDLPRYITLVSVKQVGHGGYVYPSSTKIDCNRNTQYLADNAYTVSATHYGFPIYPVAIADGDTLN